MGLLDWLFGGKKCPLCGTRGARRSEVSDVCVRCPNPTCQYFDPSLQQREVQLAGGRSRRRDFVPEHPIEIHYSNYKSVEKTFIAEKGSLLRKRNHILACVVPTGERITLSRDRILNLRDLEAVLPVVVVPPEPQPRRRDLQVLSYHKKHGTSSPLYQKLRAKYPDWRG
jgi:hypothetical protein